MSSDPVDVLKDFGGAISGINGSSITVFMVNQWRTHCDTPQFPDTWLRPTAAEGWAPEEKPDLKTSRKRSNIA